MPGVLAALVWLHSVPETSLRHSGSAAHGDVRHPHAMRVTGCPPLNGKGHPKLPRSREVSLVLSSCPAVVPPTCYSSNSVTRLAQDTWHYNSILNLAMKGVIQCVLKGNHPSRCRLCARVLLLFLSLCGLVLHYACSRVSGVWSGIFFFMTHFSFGCEVALMGVLIDFLARFSAGRGPARAHARYGWHGRPAEA